MHQTQHQIILASRSPRRAHLLRQIGFDFAIEDSNVDEVVEPERTPTENVRILSLRKATEVARRHEHGIVIGADTIVVLDDQVLGKPSSPKDAGIMLGRLSGRTHVVYTGFALVDARTRKIHVDAEHTEVTFRNIAHSEIEEYIRSGSPMDKAGAYGIQDDYGAVFVERINGCYYTVVGFPLSKFYCAFQSFIQDLD
jgi:septum formation protein